MDTVHVYQKTRLRTDWLSFTNKSFLAEFYIETVDTKLSLADLKCSAAR